ncbi:Rhs element Vgr protein [Sulfidibacter corallicola]|uniref:Gp5/Type VI secretion system Vgr protein OB-fold domain-containing protein n=1 Tax=Sulfidibacter corallicola TaxID=2818388 RepID=A0A8A4TMZ2_SULCO|nr:hypothetical protein [Sulfidibacter corallicola]QTD51359.1 hypothetical protein J3U87_02725 [Sulfidibacter corallicola]
MSSDLFHTIRQIVRQEMARYRSAELAVVQEIHPHADEGDEDNYACTVVLRNSGIVLERVPVATARPGLAAIPPSGSLVLVHFLGGDVNAPVIQGAFYNDEDRPPPNADGQWVLHLPLGAAEDEAVQAVVSSGEARSLSLKLGAGLEIDLQDDDPVVRLLVDGDKVTLQIDRDGTVNLETQSELKIKADSVTMEGTNIEINADTELILRGGVVNIN